MSQSTTFERATSPEHLFWFAISAAVVAAGFATGDLAANFTPRDLVGIALVVTLAVAVRHVLGRPDWPTAPRHFGVGSVLGAAVLLWAEFDFSVAAVTGQGNVLHGPWYTAGFGIALLWLVLARTWCPRSDFDRLD